MKNILVTGGAGYIGSHACKALARSGFTPVTFDNLSTGWRDAVKFGPFEQGDLLDRQRLDQVFSKYQPVAVMHFAALSDVGQSMRSPELYWKNNACGSQQLFDAMIAAECRKIVFSSTCATYGEQDGVKLDESCAQFPVNSYGASKRAIEDMLANYGACYGVQAVIFRYFNVAGADPDKEIGEFHRPETHLIPLVLDAILGKRASLTINGTDYETLDGTCIRDYVHVIDLIDAHLKGLDWLLSGRQGTIFNLGTGHGFSVREVLAAASAATGHQVPFSEGPKRAGDCTSLVSGSKKAFEELGWVARHSSLEEMIRDAWNWHQTGYYES